MALKKPAKKVATVKTAPKPKATKKPVAKKSSTIAKATPKTVGLKLVAKKAPTIKKVAQLSGDQLLVENLATLSSLVRTISETLDVLVQKVENMAYHLIATEEILAEVVTTTGVDLTQVNKRIRTKISKGTDKTGDPSRAIDVAAAIASPAPKSRK